MIADLMLFARPPELKPERIELPIFLAELAGSWRDQARGQQTEIRLPDAVNGSASPPAWADRSALAVAVRALVANGLEALGRGGRIDLTLADARLPADAGSSSSGEVAAVAIRVADTGPGIPPEIRPRIFDPYFSGREAGRGLGFGLCKCWRIVTLLGGRVDVQSEVGAGAAFTIVLPAASNHQP